MRRIATLAAVVGSLVLATGSSAHAQTDEPGDSGSVTIVEVGTGRAITEGDSTTVFTLDLPDAASCPGDSRNDGYRYHSFLVPPGTDVGELAYDSVRPVGSDRYFPMRTPRNNLFVHELLAPNDQAGLPALVPGDFALTFGGWPEPGLPPGTYIMGIACTEPTAWEVDKYWATDANVVLETDPDGENGEVIWRLVAADGSPALPVESDEGGGSTWIVLLVVVAAALVGGAVYVRRRSVSPSPLERQAS